MILQERADAAIQLRTLFFWTHFKYFSLNKLNLGRAENKCEVAKTISADPVMQSEFLFY